MLAPVPTQDELKRAVASAALGFVKPGEIIGVGTGSTVDFFIDELAKLASKIKGAVASSDLPRLVKPEHLAPLAPIDDVRASADYRAEAALVVVRRLLAELAV